MTRNEPHPPTGPRIALESFEQQVYGRQLQAAVQTMVAILKTIEAGGEWTAQNERSDDGLSKKPATRLAAAIAALLSDPGVDLGPPAFEILTQNNRSLTSIFEGSGFGSAAHAFARIWAAARSSTKVDRRAIWRRALAVGSLATTPPEVLREIVEEAPELVLPTVLGQLANQIALTPEAEVGRSRLFSLGSALEGLPLNDLFVPVLSAAWMLTSYAASPTKHEFKTHLNRLLSRWTKSKKVDCPMLPKKRVREGRPTLIVMNESFASTHAMFRCFGPSIQPLRERFKLISISRKQDIDDEAKRMFDEVVVIEFVPSEIRKLVGRVLRLQPDVIYFPSLGMRDWSLCLASLRLAPIQVMTLGHPATSYLQTIDFVLAQEHVVKYPECFSESILVLRRGAHAFAARSDAVPIEPRIETEPAVLRIAVPSNAQKLNAPFLSICRRIQEKVERRIEFHFFPNAIGLAHRHMSSVIHHVLRNSKVYPRTDYNTYIRNLNQCDVQFGTFPFGGTNSNIDAMKQGIPLLALEGAEPFARTDAEMSRIARLPEWLIACDESEYEAAAIRLLTDDRQRLALSHQLLETDLDAAFFAGHSESNHREMADTVWWLYQNFEAIRGSGKKIWRSEDREFPIA